MLLVVYICERRIFMCSNLFVIVGTDLKNNSIPIISDGNRFFALGDCIFPRRYETCIEVADKYRYF